MPQASQPCLSPTVQQIINASQFVHQPLLILNQANPVQNTWYTIMPTTLNTRVYTIRVQVDTTGEDLEVEIIADGITYSQVASCLANTGYYPCTSTYYSAPSLAVGVIGAYQDTQTLGFIAPLETRSISIRIRKTTNNGNGTLLARVVWDSR